MSDRLRDADRAADARARLYAGELRALLGRFEDEQRDVDWPEEQADAVGVLFADVRGVLNRMDAGEPLPVFTGGTVVDFDDLIAERGADVLPFSKRAQLEHAGTGIGMKDSSGRWVQRVCVGCGKEFSARISSVTRGGGKYCSRDCWRAHPPKRSEEGTARVRLLNSDRAGEKNPNFRHGRRTGDHMRGWNPAAKGEECCRVCGSSDWLNLHHIVPRSICTPEAKRDLRNGVVLCASCHQKWHKGTLTIPRELLRDEEWAYVSSLALTGREISGYLAKHYPSGGSAA